MWGGKRNYPALLTILLVASFALNPGLIRSFFLDRVLNGIDLEKAQIIR